ncbi:MAG: MbtH family protein [Verrucomicrobia bacterium]|nr:MbtH family protein [Verrucomicrobiota bacterium]
MNNQIDHLVVINDEEQYSIWPSFKNIPAGWKREGFEGSKEACLEHISKVWTDMRPLSLRSRMESRKNELEKLIKEIQTQPAESPPKSSTVDFLLGGDRPFHVHPSQTTPQEFNRALEIGSIHLVFTGTKGETCLRIDFPKKDSINAHPPGSCLIEGMLELDFVPLCCSANIDLSSMKGFGRFKKRENN